MEIKSNVVLCFVLFFLAGRKPRMKIFTFAVQWQPELVF
jgi:hypothetical protein